MKDHLGDPAAEWAAATEGVALVRRDDVRVLFADGPDILPLLHRLSTNAVADLGVGDGRQTVLTTAKGRIVERLWVQRSSEREVVLVGGRGPAAPVLEHLARYTVTERTGLNDGSEDAAVLSLVGPGADAVAPGLAGDGTVLAFDGHGPAGGSVVVARDRAEDALGRLRAAVEAAGGREVGRRADDGWRILRGLPATGHEIDERWNPLEAGLRDAVAFDKGCYLGQEVVARLENYAKVSRSLLRLAWADAAAVPIGAELVADGRSVGVVTSAVATPDGRGIGLGLVKRRVLEDDPELRTSDGVAIDRAPV